LGGCLILSIFHFNPQHDSNKEMSNERQYCIVDIETTGGQRGRHKMTEIAIVRFDGEKIIDRFESLLNPEMSIPYHITQLTGITNEMVADAPKFYEIAKKIVEMTQDTIFVAHNVFFDYNFVQAEFRDLGYTFKARKMCTVRLARKIFPGHKSYSLGNICKDLGIDIKARHRAMGDAEATTELFRQMIQKSPDLVTTVEEQNSKKLSLPPHLKQEDFDNLPNRPGVYFFWNEKEELLYIGKSKEIKKRISSHFRLNIKRQKDIELKNSVHRITYEETGSDFIALIYECHLIKKLEPFFNVSMRKRNYPYTLDIVYDENGFADFKIIKAKDLLPTAIHLKSKQHAKKIIDKFYKDEFGLTYESHLFQNQREIFLKTLGQDAYNQRFENFLNYLAYPHENFSIAFNGRKDNEKCYLEVKDSQLHGLRYISKDKKTQEHDNEFIKIQEDADMRNLFISYLAKQRPKLLTDSKQFG
jgi:DNA polymerase-3 subunit epsilon